VLLFKVYLQSVVSTSMSLARFSKYMASWRAKVAGVVEPAAGVSVSVARAHTSPGANGATTGNGDHPLPKVPRKEFAGDERALKQAGRRLVEDAGETLRPVNVGGEGTSSFDNDYRLHRLQYC
jgi:hypothetical protein